MSNTEHLWPQKCVSNRIESSVFEYCVVFGMSCIALLLPDLHSIHFSNHLIPKQILTTIRQFNDYSDSNIFILKAIIL